MHLLIMSKKVSLSYIGAQPLVTIVFIITKKTYMYIHADRLSVIQNQDLAKDALASISIRVALTDK